MQYASNLPLVTTSVSAVRRNGCLHCELTSRFCSSIRRISASSPWCRSRAESKVSATKVRVAQYCSTFVRGAVATGAENHVPLLCRSAEAPLLVTETFIPVTANCMVRDMAAVLDAPVAGPNGDCSLSRGFRSLFMTTGWSVGEASNLE